MPIPVTHKAADPEEILRQLPASQREHFLREYNTAVDAAHEVRRYRQLQDVLHVWGLRAIAYSQPDFAQRARDAAARDADKFIRAEHVIPGLAGENP